MNKEERLNAALAYLLAHGVVKTKKEFAARLGMAVGTVSRALHGNEASLTDNLMLNVYRVFRPVFNYDWIMSGDGAMLDHSLPEPGCVGPAPRLSPENARLVYRKQPPVDVDVADDELSSRCNNCTNSDDGMAHEDLASASHDGDGDDAEQSQADIDRDWEEKAQPILGEQSQDKLQAELDRIRKIRTDTDKANREAHAMPPSWPLCAHQSRPHVPVCCQPPTTCSRHLPPPASSSLTLRPSVRLLLPIRPLPSPTISSILMPVMQHAQMATNNAIHSQLLTIRN